MRPIADQWYTNHAAPFARIGILCLTTKHMAWLLSRYSLEWTDSTTPRTDAPILFRPFMGRSATFYTGHAARFITR